ncbi:hypothetical protein AXF42_Ash013888 [Apostasia shenzhenica]|uniref:Uncharacterized protein n=1 Tax=Apostasia shenzhenica TaxID=1088818 RepID=A0A2I0AS70_9ASPA|nr:hypothetical protein AXF42_Ash013888 [Apostasia shenzhenica]
MAGRRASSVARRAWRLLRLAVHWARKPGGTSKHRLLLNPLVLPCNAIKSPRRRGSCRVHYSERQFSFNETPDSRFKTHRRTASLSRLLPCLAPDVDFDGVGGEEDDEDVKFLESGEGEDDGAGWDSEFSSRSSLSSSSPEIDLRAERFIEKFYEQMRLPRGMTSQ